MELHLKYHPKVLKNLLGQPEAVKTLQGFLKNGGLPHALLLSGPSGVGKTSAARILASELECSDRDFCEINAASSRGIDTIREIQQRMGLSPMGGKSRIYLLDEAHELSHRAGGNAQSALLKVLEGAPSHVYFILATTEPEGLLRTIRTRCSEVKFKAISPKDLEGLLRGVASKEGMEVSDTVLEQIVESCQGSARQALKFLEQVAGIEDDEDRINVILSTDSKRQGIEIARALMDPRSSWAQVASMIKNVVEEPETVRHIVLTYTSSYLLNLKGGPKANNAYLILTAFEANFFDSKKSGLVRAAWEVMASRTRK